jgi:phenylacetate-CoA ligase
MNRLFAKYLNSAGAFLRGEPINSSLLYLNKTQYFPLEKIRDIQLEKMKRLLSHAFHNVEYYKEIFKKYRIHPQNINSYEDIKKIPLLTKADIQNNLKKMIAINHLKPLSKAKTSGTTGIPLILYKDRITSSYHRASIYRGIQWYGLDIGALQARLWGVPVNHTDRFKVKIIDFLLNRFREKSMNFDDKVLYGFYEKMKKKKPDYIRGYTSMVYQFAQFLKENNLSVPNQNLKMVICTAETIFEFQKIIIEETLGRKLVSEYGCAEAGIISFECPLGGHHIMSDCIYEEFLETDDLSSRNAYKEIIVTDLHNYSMPIIRYRLGDRIVPKEDTCQCGRGLPLIEKVEGRLMNFVLGVNGKKYHETIFDYTILQLIKNNIGIKHFKVYQKAVDEIKIELVKNDYFDEAGLQYISNKIKDYLGRETKIYFEFVDNIQRESSGKLRYFVSELI